ncbi:MAG: hypothetical protein JNM31_15820 [Flavobacteriales bacterium]|nr:hypothetical protein [Flavobacteriales bacterium]
MRPYLLAFLCLACPGLSLVAQQTSKPVDPDPGTWYFTSGGEWIFSAPMLDVQGGTPGSIAQPVQSGDQGAVVRWAPFFNAQGVGNYDFSKSVGMFVGLAIRNVGFIYAVPNDSLDRRYKFRTYNVGVPIGLKFGRMNGGLFFLGYEPELVLHYKEKKFQDERKDRFSVWFSDRTDLFTHSVMAGFQFGNGACLKVKYYLNNFHNTSFEETVDGVRVRPYAGLNANVLYVSIGFGLFKKESYDIPGITPGEQRASRF